MVPGSLEEKLALAEIGSRIGGVTTSQSKYVLWRSPDSRLRVEFPQALLEEIRAEVVRNAHSIPGAGSEIGGILLGTRLESLVRVLAWVPIECQRAFGPAFLLSGQDEDRLQAQLTELKRRSERTGLHPVGWLASRLQGDLQPTADHRRLHAAHFLESQKLLLICQPDLLGDARIQVSVRYENEDRLTTYPNQLVAEPAIERSIHRRRPGAETNPALASRTSRWTRVRTNSRAGYTPPQMAKEPESAEPVRGGDTARTPIWVPAAMLAATMVLFVALGALWLRNQGEEPVRWSMERLHLGRWLSVSEMQRPSPPLPLPSLRADATQGRLRVRWEPAGLSHLDALSGLLEVRAGQEVVRVPLNAARLRGGSEVIGIAAVPQSVRFEYRTAGGRRGEETLRFPGSRATSRR